MIWRPGEPLLNLKIKVLSYKTQAWRVAMCLVSVHRSAGGDIINIPESVVVCDLPHLCVQFIKICLKEKPTLQKTQRKRCPLVKWHDRCSPSALSDGKWSGNQASVFPPRLIRSSWRWWEWVRRCRERERQKDWSSCPRNDLSVLDGVRRL